MIGTATLESRLQVPQKLKNGSAFWPSDSTCGNLSKETQSTYLKEHKHPYVHCNVIYNHRDMETDQASISRCLDKTTMGHLHNRIPLGCKKEEYFTVCNSMDAPGEYKSEWNKPVRKKQIPHDFTHLWNLMNKLN